MASTVKVADHLVEHPLADLCFMHAEKTASSSSISTVASSGAGSAAESAGHILERAHCDCSELFIVGAVLGQGSFACALKATCKNTGTEVALKVPHNSAEVSGCSWHKEVGILQKLSHPNIVRYHGAPETGRYLAMEICHGGSLAEALAKCRGSRCSDAETKNVFRQVISAVAHLHSVGIVHRDLKLGNFVLQDENVPLAESTVKLIDFGLATELSSDSGRLRTKCGSLLYMAPEVYFCDSYDEKCDIWSCGVMLFCMLCGRLPFEGRSLQQVMDNVKRQPPCQVASEWRGVSLQARQLVGRLLCKVPESRWSAKQVKEIAWLRGTAASPSAGHLVARRTSSGICAGMV